MLQERLSKLYERLRRTDVRESLSICATTLVPPLPSHAQIRRVQIRTAAHVDNLLSGPLLSSCSVVNVVDYGLGNNVLCPNISCFTGGVFEEAVSMASMMLDDGLVVARTVRNSNVVDNTFRVGALSKEVFPARKAPLTDLPVTILINHGSASASEVFTAAMQDNNR